MKIDNTPAIRAFVEERLREANFLAPYPNPHAEEVRLARVDELNLILALCDGLQKQNDTLATAYAKANIPEPNSQSLL